MVKCVVKLKNCRIGTKIGVVVDMDPGEKKAKNTKKSKEQKNKKKQKKASQQKTHTPPPPPRCFLYLRETNSWRWLEEEKGEEGREGGKKSV